MDAIARFWELYEGGPRFTVQHHLVVPTIYAAELSDIDTTRIPECLAAVLRVLLLSCYGCRAALPLDGSQPCQLAFRAMLGTVDADEQEGKPEMHALRIGVAYLCGTCSVATLRLDARKRTPIIQIGQDEVDFLVQVVQEAWSVFVATGAPRTLHVRGADLVLDVLDLANRSYDLVRSKVADQSRVCVMCDRLVETGGGVCRQCHTAFYCGVECQRADWPAHAPICRLLANPRESPAGNVVWLTDAAFRKY